MRYFVVLQEAENRRPYIVAETVREAADDGVHRSLSLAGGIGGPTARIVTEDELRGEAGGTEALEAWHGKNDEVFEAEDLLLTATDNDRRERVPLRIVRALPDVTRLPLESIHDGHAGEPPPGDTPG